jgi:hypothetical protein
MASSHTAETVRSATGPALQHRCNALDQGGGRHVPGDEVGDGPMSIDSAAYPVIVSLAGRPPVGPDGTQRCRPERRTRAHHDRLLRVEDDPDEVVELLELAVTWSELDYSEVAVVPPEAWIDFAVGHRWRHPERVLRLFSLAADVALRGPHRLPAPVAAPCSATAAARRGLADADLLAGEL